MIVKSLVNTPFEELMQCFQLAFDGYFIQMPTDNNYYWERWKAAKVDYGLSFGMFDKGKLVGFILHAVDVRNGLLTAYNSGTGVIPEYRGKRIVNSIYDIALKELRRNNIQRTTLEVITKNERAIRLYKGVGFSIYRHYKCFKGNFKADDRYKFEIKEIYFDNVEWEKLPHQQLYSWDNQKESILAGNYKFYQVFNDKIPESYFIINPKQNYVAQLGLLDRDGSWERLFNAIKHKADSIKINNVEERLTDKLAILEKVGLENVIDQYEMEMTLVD